MSKFDIITIGDLCVDLILTGENVTPEFGQEEKLIDAYDLRMGGSCSIFASQAAKLGLKVGIVGVVGDDAFGKIVLQTLAEAGVDTSLVRVDSRIKTGLSVHLQQRDERSILTYLGSITATQFDDVYKAVADTRHLHIGSYFLLTQLHEVFPAIVREVRSAGATVSLDTNWDPEEKWDVQQLLRAIDVFLPNETEVKAISGCSSLEDALDKMKNIVPVIAVKLGSAGAIGQKGETRIKVVAPSVKAVDTIGAGDSFDAGFLYGFLKGKSLQESLIIASACGTASVLKPGGTAGQLRESDLSDWLEQFNCYTLCQAFFHQGH